MRILAKGAMLALCLGAFASSEALADDGGVCPRPAAQTEVQPPPDLYSQNGVLNVTMNYFTSVDNLGRTLFCFVTTDGKESPTLHVNPGDTLKVKLTNMVPAAPGAPTSLMTNPDDACADPLMTLTSVNMHFHGTNVSPACHGDEVIHTMISSGDSYQYTLHIPKDEPPGLYWYHPHIHGISSMAVQGGATGVIEVEGIANIQPAVAGLPERYLLLRDQQEAEQTSFGTPPNWDVSVNYVPVNYPTYKPATITMQQGSTEFWRVANTAANTIMNLQVLYDGVAQPLQIVAFDGVPTGSKDGRQQGQIVTQTDVLLAPAARAEFMVVAPPASVKVAQLVTLAIDGGVAADNNPARPLANIALSQAPAHLPKVAMPTGHTEQMRFNDLANAKVTAKRKLYFSEYFTKTRRKPAHAPEQEAVSFYITVQGQKETLFDPNNPPAITTTQGAVEEWTIENQTQELHEFHMHQVHFLVQAVNGVAIPKAQQQLYDTFQVPYWDGFSTPYPSIKVKLDFRGPTVGDFVYHCHILDHEDGGMMAIIRVLPKGAKKVQVDAAQPALRQASAARIGAKAETVAFAP